MMLRKCVQYMIQCRYALDVNMSLNNNMSLCHNVKLRYIRSVYTYRIVLSTIFPFPKFDRYALAMSLCHYVYLCHYITMSLYKTISLCYNITMSSYVCSSCIFVLYCLPITPIIGDRIEPGWCWLNKKWISVHNFFLIGLQNCWMVVTGYSVELFPVSDKVPPCWSGWFHIK